MFHVTYSQLLYTASPTLVHMCRNKPLHNTMVHPASSSHHHHVLSTRHLIFPPTALHTATPPPTSLSPLHHFPAHRLSPSPARRAHGSERAPHTHQLPRFQVAAQGLADCLDLRHRNVFVQEDCRPAQGRGISAQRTGSRPFS